MSFWSVLSNIRKNLEGKFEKNANKAVNDPDDGKQAQQDAQKGGEDTSSTARDGANDEIKSHDPAWKPVKDLSDKALETIPKVEAAAKYGWLKFVGVVTAMFVFITAYSFRNNLGGPTDEQIRMYNNERTIAIQAEQIKQMEKVMVNQEEFNAMVNGLFVQSAPEPTPDAPVPVAAAAPEIAEIAAEPATVELTTDSGETTQVTTTVGRVYGTASSPVRQVIVQSPPPRPITHGYDGTEDTSHDCLHTHCLSPHKTFTVNSGFASVKVSY